MGSRATQGEVRGLPQGVRGLDEGLGIRKEKDKEENRMLEQNHSRWQQEHDCKASLGSHFLAHTGHRDDAHSLHVSS